MSADEYAYLRELVTAHKRRLQALELHAARYGLKSDPGITIEIDEIKQKLIQLEGQLPTEVRTTPQDRQAAVAGIYPIAKVFTAPFYYAVAAVRLALVHPTLLTAITQQATQLDVVPTPIRILWEEAVAVEKPAIGPVLIRHVPTARFLITYLTATTPEYLPSLRKKSLSLSINEIHLLGADVGSAQLEIVPAAHLFQQVLHLVPARENYRESIAFADYEWGEEEEEEEE